jgi:Ca2+:H+ antiporter
VYWLLSAGVVAVVLDRAGAAAPLVFLCAALAIVPLATLIVHSTEHLAAHTGPALGGLLNATFGNLPELIIAMVALRAGLVEMVRASLIGVLLANLLLALGVGFLLGGLRHRVQEYNPAAARTYATMMLLAAVGMVVPSTFHRLLGVEAPRHAQALDTGVCLVLLVAYGLYLVFMLRTHPEHFAAMKGGEAEHGAGWSLARAGSTLVLASVGAAWMSDTLVGAAEATGQALGMSPLFLGIVLLAVVGGAAESGAAIAMARKNQMDLAVGIALGSSLQIALFVTPVLVLLSLSAGGSRLRGRLPGHPGRGTHQLRAARRRRRRRGRARLGGRPAGLFQLRHPRHARLRRHRAAAAPAPDALGAGGRGGSILHRGGHRLAGERLRSPPSSRRLRPGARPPVVIRAGVAPMRLYP